LAPKLPQRFADLFASPWVIFTQLNLRHKLYVQYNNKYRPPQYQATSFVSPRREEEGQSSTAWSL
jgi:hypothetical protein